ncbi:hypothetical protein JCM33774_60620 [Actinophytocola sp. KF-1]
MVAVACVVSAVAELTDNVVDHDGLTVLDRPWHRWLVDHRTPGLNRVMEWVSVVGGTVVLAVLAAVVAGWLLLRRQRADAVLVAVTTAGAALLVPVIKHVVARPPGADRLVVEASASYPSGHGVCACAVLGVLTVVLVARLTSRVLRVAAIVVGVLAVAAIGVSRVYLGVHWPSDVLAGWLFGGLWLMVCLAFTSYWRRPNAPLPTLTAGVGER